MSIKSWFAALVHSEQAFTAHAKVAILEKEWLALQNARDVLTVKTAEAKAKWETAHLALPDVIVSGKVIVPAPVTNSVAVQL